MVQARKLAGSSSTSVDAIILDYHDATPNPAHDPGNAKGRPVGKGAINP